MSRHTIKIKSLTSRPYLTSFVCAAITFVTGISALLLRFGQPGSHSVEAMTRLALIVFVPAVVTGLVAKRALKRWSVMKTILFYACGLVTLIFLQLMGSYR